MAGLYSSKKETEFQAQLASLAVTIEAMEQILVEKGLLSTGQLMQEALKLSQRVMNGGLANG